MILEDGNYAHIFPISDFNDEILKYYRGEIKEHYFEMGEWAELKDCYRPALGTLNIISGIPGHGKSSWMDAMMVRLSKDHGIKWGVFSPENYPTRTHIQKIHELWSGMSYFHGDVFTKMSEERLGETIEDIGDKFQFFQPPEELLTLSYILKLAEAEIEIGEVNAIVIDPWNELVTEKDEGQNESEYIGQALSTCRRFARVHNILFFILAHPAKMYKKPDAKEYDVPTLYSISGSAHWYNKADNGITVFRHFNPENRAEETVDICIQKIKFKRHGKIGVISMKYNFYNGRFTETKVEVKDERGRFDF